MQPLYGSANGRERRATHDNLGGVELIGPDDPIGFEIGDAEARATAMTIFCGVSTSRICELARLTIPRLARALTKSAESIRN